MSRSPLGHRAPVCWLLLPFIAGLIGAKLSPAPLPVAGLLVGSMAAVLASLWLAAERPGAWALVLAAGLAALGAAYYELRRQRLPAWDALPRREARLAVEITRAFAATSPDRFAGLGRVVGADPHLADLVGQRIALSLHLEPDHTRPIRGARIAASGVLEALPRRPPADDFEAYLVDSGINFRLGRGVLREVLDGGSRYARWRERLRGRAADQLGLGLHGHPGLVAALRGMLLGERSGLSESQKTLYLHGGAMHLFAISGLHIAVIAGGLLTVLRLARLPPLATFLAGSAALMFYVDLTGALPSAVRAWLMLTCLHGAFVLRAPGNAVSALAISALLVLLLDPMQLFGAGFQMSYSIVTALLLYGLPLRERWIATGALWRQLPPVSWNGWHRASAAGWQALQGAVAINLAAALVGTLSAIAFFGVFTPVGVVANLLLIPLAGIAILGGFASLVTGCFGLPPAGLLFNHAAALTVAAMQGLLEHLVALPGAARAAHFRSEWLGSGALLLLMGAMAWGYAGAWHPRRGGYWTPLACVVLMLVLAVRFD